MSETRRCHLCERDLSLDRFLTITERKKRGTRVYEYVKPSYDCRDCRAEERRERRRRKAEEAGRPFVSRGDQKAAGEKRKAWRRVAWAICLAFWKLVKVSAKDRIARAVKRQRERRHSDPAYWADCKARKLRRTRAQRGTQVEPVSLHRVAGREVTRATWSMDHVVPLSKGGPHTYENVRLAHRSCNSSRGNRGSSPTPGVAKVLPERAPGTGKERRGIPLRQGDEIL